MDESGIEATQALDFGDYDDDVTDDELDENTPIAFLNVACQKGFPGKLYPVYEGDNVIGRGNDCKISIPLKALSREHACIEVKGDSHFIYDKGSRNRTRRNKHFLAASVRYELKDKDKLVFGDVECEYQLGNQAAKEDDDETGSESMFQTAPDDEELEKSTETNDRTEVKLPEDEDYASDASSDILQPTQHTVGNTQSMLGHRTLNGNSTLAQNITVKETPAASRIKRFTEDIVLPESGSDTDEEGSRGPPATLAIAADSQDDEDDENLKSRMMGAATQAYICESDITTDDEQDIASKRSLLSAPTQAFVEDDDLSTCSEDSPKKKMLLTAATQAYAANSEDEKTPKKQGNIEPTQAYTMDLEIEPNQGYEMDIEPEGKDENVEEKKSSSILFEPTQAYLGNETAGDKEDDAQSDTSEEFVLEGDTDAEDNGDDVEMMAAATLACEDLPTEETETQVISAEEPTQVIQDEKSEDDATVAVCDEPTQVFDEPKAKGAGRKTRPQPDETLPVTEMETQVFEENTGRKTSAMNDDATQVFDENVEVDRDTKNQEKPADGETETQVFDNENDGKVKGSALLETQVIEGVGGKGSDETDNKTDHHNEEEMATQVFDVDEHAENDEGKEFDVTAASTLAVNENLDEESSTEADTGVEDATQVFDEVAVSDGQTVPVESAPEHNKSRGRDKRKNCDETVPISDATQIIQNKPSQSKPSRGRRKKAEKTEETLPVSDDATQVFDDTVAVTEDQTVAVHEDATQVFEENSSLVKSSKKEEGKVEDISAITDDATQVFDETVPVSEDQTVAVTEDQTVALNEDATQIVESTDKPVKAKATRGKRRQAKKSGKPDVSTEEATQVFDETVPVEGIVGDNHLEAEAKDEVKKTEDATQVFDETGNEDEKVDALRKPEESEEKPNTDTRGKRLRGNKNKTGKDENNSDNAAVGDNLTKTHDSAPVKTDEKKDVKAVSTTSRKSGRSRGKAAAPDVEEGDTNKYQSKGIKGKSDQSEDRKPAKAANKGKKKPTAKDKALEVEEPCDEAATQRYGGSGDEGPTQRYGDSGDEGTTQRYGESGNEAATQRYGDSGDEGATQRYGESGNEAATQRYGDSGDEGATQRYGEDDDLTPDLNEIEDEKQHTVPVVTETSRGRSPLKSALASPKKKASPSPKKVQFVSQDSETGSESGEPSRRSKRRLKGNHIEKETENKNEMQTSAKTRNKRQTRQEVVTSDDYPVLEEPAGTDNRPMEETVKSESNVASKTNEGMKNKRKTRGKEKNTIENVESAEPKIEVPVTSKKRGRKSVDTVIGEKITNTRRKSRVSLPAVLEGNEPEDKEIVSSNKSRKGAVEKDNEVEEKEIDKKKKRGKETVKEGKEINDDKELNDNKEINDNKELNDNEELNDNNKTKVTDHSLRQRVKNSKASVQKEDNSNAKSETNIVSETEVSVDTKEGKRTGRQTRGTVQVDLTKAHEETESDVTNENSNTAVEPSITRSKRNSKKKDKSEALVDDNVKNREIDNIKFENDKRESSPKPSTRTRGNKNKNEDSQTSDMKDDKEVTEQTDSKTGRKTGKAGRTRGAEVKTENSEENDTPEVKCDVSEEKSEKINEKEKVKGKTMKVGKGNKDELDSVDTNENTEQTSGKSSARGKAGKGSKGKQSKTEPNKPTGKEEKTGEIENDKSVKSGRSKKGGTSKAVVKEEKQEVTANEENLPARSRRLKRKESDTSSNDSQNDGKGETPAKRQKANSNISTPKNTGKQGSTMTTPKVQANKQLDTSVTNSPTLRKTTTEGMKAKVMFTGVIDEQGEKIVKELGGELVSSVIECTHLVTDQVRRTVKFLCSLSRGIPIVSPQWLVSSKTSGFFVDPTPFYVRDDAAERKYKFRLDHSIDKASKEQVFQGFTFHVTKSVKPEPKHMSDILKCAGAKCVNKMPTSSPKGQTVVISCPEDQAQCEPAYKAGVPVMTAEFILTGILRQEVDLQAFKLTKEDNGNKRHATSHPSDNNTKKRKR